MSSIPSNIINNLFTALGLEKPIKTNGFTPKPGVNLGQLKSDTVDVKYTVEGNASKSFLKKIDDFISSFADTVSMQLFGKEASETSHTRLDKQFQYLPSNRPVNPRYAEPPQGIVVNDDVIRVTDDDGDNITITDDKVSITDDGGDHVTVTDNGVSITNVDEQGFADDLLSAKFNPHAIADSPAVIKLTEDNYRVRAKQDTEYVIGTANIDNRIIVPSGINGIKIDPLNGTKRKLNHNNADNNVEISAGAHYSTVQLWGIDDTINRVNIEPGAKNSRVLIRKDSSKPYQGVFWIDSQDNTTKVLLESLDLSIAEISRGYQDRLMIETDNVRLMIAGEIDGLYSEAEGRYYSYAELDRLSV